MDRTRRVILSATAASVALLGVGGYALSTRRSGDALAACRKGVAAGGMESFGGAFTLTDATGARVTDRDVFAKPALLYFGYTFCPDVCPTDNARNALAVDLLKGRGYDIRPVFVTVDPHRDTPEVLRDYTAAMHPDMVGLTGTDDEIAAVNKAWRNYYKLHDDDKDDPYYLVDHMTNTYLVLPDQGTVEFFTRDITPEEMADRTACFLDAAPAAARTGV